MAEADAAAAAAVAAAAAAAALTATAAAAAAAAAAAVDAAALAAATAAAAAEAGRWFEGVGLTSDHKPTRPDELARIEVRPPTTDVARAPEHHSSHGYFLRPCF